MAIRFRCRTGRKLPSLDTAERGIQMWDLAFGLAVVAAGLTTILIWRLVCSSPVRMASMKSVPASPSPATATPDWDSASPAPDQIAKTLEIQRGKIHPALGREPEIQRTETPQMFQQHAVSAAPVQR